MELSFIIVDDRELDCFIAEKLIQKAGFNKNNKVFYDAINALNHIKAIDQPTGLTIILLDVMMPVMNGFEFIETFENLPAETIKNYRIIPITTSLNKNDINKIANYDSVVGVLKKPYTFETLVNFIKLVLKEEG